jgi:hypothetical protein
MLLHKMVPQLWLCNNFLYRLAKKLLRGFSRICMTKWYYLTNALAKNASEGGRLCGCMDDEPQNRKARSFLRAGAVRCGA